MQVTTEHNNEHNTRLFEYVLARSAARESSILAVASIAASASLVLFGLYLQVLCDDNVCGNKLTQDFIDIPVKIIGILFAITGLAYRAITAHGIHKDHENWLKEVSCYSSITKQDLLWRLRRHEYGKLREGLIYLLLALPIIAWLYIIVLAYSEVWAEFVLWAALYFFSVYILSGYFAIVQL